MANRKPRLTAKTAEALKSAAMLCDEEMMRLSDDDLVDKEYMDSLLRAANFLWALAHWKEEHDG